VDRADPASRTKTKRAIEDHAAQWQQGRRPLLLFPEGTTSNGDDLLESRRSRSAAQHAYLDRSSGSGPDDAVSAASLSHAFNAWSLHPTCTAQGASSTDATASSRPVRSRGLWVRGFPGTARVLSAAATGLSAVRLFASPPAAASMWPGVLLTGTPGMGKSTASRRVVELCEARGVRVEGFLTEEIRGSRGERVGFELVGLGSARGQKAPLARSGPDAGSGPQVSKYTVCVAEFEALALPILDRVLSESAKGQTDSPAVVCVVDEIGKMELFSEAFVSRMRQLLRSRPTPTLITVALRGGGLIAESKRAPGFKLIELNHSNRDGAPDNILAKLLRSGSGPAQKASASSVGKEQAAVTVRPPSRWRARPTTAGQSPTQEVQRDEPAQHPSDRISESAAAATSAGGGSVVVWLRNELRLADNPLLMRGLQLCRDRPGAKLVLAVCLDPREFGPDARTAFGSPKVGEARRRFIEESLAELQTSVSRRGSKLLVCDAAPEEALPVIASGCGASLILATRQSCPAEKTAEARVARALQAMGASLELQDPGGIYTLFGQSELKRTGVATDADFPEEFLDFYGPARNRLREVCQRGLSEAPSRLPEAALLQTQPPGLRADGATSYSTPTSKADLPWQGGEAAATQRLQSWLAAGGLSRYKTTFRRLLGDFSSRLSPHLAMGCISPRRVAAEVMGRAESTPAVHLDHYTYELCWRDFFVHAAGRWGQSLFELHGPLGQASKYGAATKADAEAGRWRRDAVDEERWRKGLTGVPLIDAAMREVLATGYMGNLARQITAAFLVEELGLDWRVGADWFEATLVDYDPHSNWGQWARSAGVAPTNEAKRRRVGGTRYYDIALALPGGEAAQYVRKWLPELAAVPDGQVFAPWATDAPLTGSYPREPLASPSLRRYFEAQKGAVFAGSAGKGKGKGKGKDKRQETDNPSTTERRWGR
ncbi:unnamed protein product, partial [Polarella glacialis]